MMSGLIELTRAPRLAHRTASPRTRSEPQRLDIWYSCNVSRTLFTKSSSTARNAACR